MCPAARRIVAPVLALAVLGAVLLAARPAAAFRLIHQPVAVADNPADRLAELAPDPEDYQQATHCSKMPRPGMKRLIAWLERTADGVSWGTYRCERWGDHEASLHAEGRALDWHLDVGDRAGRREARRLIELFLAPDRLGTPHALARRMGIQEIIWDCSYWAAGMVEFGPYGPCVNKHGQVRRHINPTVAHRDHLHIGLTKEGAMGRSSFWAASRPSAAMRALVRRG